MRWAIVILFLAGCSPAFAQPAPPPKIKSCIDDVADPFAADALRTHLATLADPGLDGRAPGTPGDVAARAYVADRFKCLGLAPIIQTFDDTANVIAIVPGNANPPETIVIGAHLDHLGNKHLGANDDASGITAMLAIAQSIQRTPLVPETKRRTLVFAAFGAEELGEHGSTFFAAHPPDGISFDTIVYDVNLDMVGSYASHRGVVALGDFPTQPVRPVLTRLTATVRPPLNVVAGGRGVGSDHEAFCSRGIPYLFFWTPDDACYHRTCDTLRNIDFPHMAQIARLAGDLVRALADPSLPLASARGKRDCAGAIVRER